MAAHARSSPALLEMRQGRARAQHDAGQVHGDQPVPFVERGLLDALADEDAGIVHQHVELAELLDRGVHGGGPARLAGDVERDVERLAARRLDLLRRLPAALVEHVADRHLGAGAGHQLGRRAADAARRARQERDLAVQPVHAFLLDRCANRSRFAAMLPGKKKQTKKTGRATRHAPRSADRDRRHAGVLPVRHLAIVCCCR